MNFMDPGYLLSGSSLQIQVGKALQDLRVFERLSDFKPVLAGTYPLDLAIEGSDLDILCEVYRPEKFIGKVKECYGGEANFSVRKKRIHDIDTIIIRFKAFGYPVELFAQPIAVTRQDAFLHMVTEWYLLENDLSGAKPELLELKRSGWTTESAFAHLLGVREDPYRALIDLGNTLRLYS